ncbi:uncharacterized protein EV420DRAFT_89225 [Desarmillaria tabescens]|uniref:Uncharacterized protein n=1 Tax=Armillaria tabescens TaxID=1929756 RepID=A0AA39U915_ARMTA|nr:uncharacterized protein EV420DRAFT_89225 [Desarmillaria tabescens]KAK0470085.1 hypothetical protein EV420DRAFT_89225 [Desarmillaria tabescens]
MFALDRLVLLATPAVASTSSSASPSRMPTPDSSTMANYVELAAQVVPQNKTGLASRLRSGCRYLPMPLYMGWDTDSLTEAPADSTKIPHFKLTDMQSGATREIEASWMHALYTYTSSHHDGVTLLHLKEAGYSSHLSWQHTVIVVTLAVQLGLAVYGFAAGQGREGLIILLGLIVRGLEGVVAWAYPTTLPPRIVRTPRFYALHTGMTTSRILVVAHEPATKKNCGVEYINLEDSAVPLSRNNASILESSCKGALKIFGWAQKVVVILSPSDGFLFSVALLLGSIVVEVLSRFTDTLPAYSASTPLETGGSLLDKMTAACQATNCVSVGLVEAMLPDPAGEHRDYKWISRVVTDGASNAGLHPTHPEARSIRTTASKRRTVRRNMGV